MIRLPLHDHALLLVEPRRSILRICSVVEQRPTDLKDLLGITHPAVSQHLAHLLETKLISVRKKGTQRFYKTEIENVERLLEQICNEVLGG